MKREKFPVYKVDYIFNKFNGKLINKPNLIYSYIEINYPCRLDAMAINPSAVCYNSDMIFTPGEVVISTKKYINVKIKKTNDVDSITIGESTKRKCLVKHAYYLMKKVLRFSDSLHIDVDDSDIPKHCGFGSSSSLIAAVSTAINEMYNNPISKKDLIKYLASNHGEEISDNNENELKMVQCIGGGATNGLTEEGIIIIAGQATTIAKTKYTGKILIGIPNDFKIKDANYLMEKEEENLYKFKKTGDKYSKIIAYDMLHRALPEINNGEIDSLSDIVFDYRFNMGSIDNCSFVYDKLNNLAKEIRVLYEEKKCKMLGLSSVGPAFFVITNNCNDYKYCKQFFKKLDLKIFETEINNDYYKIENKIIYDGNNFWCDKSTRSSFENRPCSKYITNEIDKIVTKNMRCIDIGCGGGRYARYLNNIQADVLAIDKYPNMSVSLHKDKIRFLKAPFDNIPCKDEICDVILSIGVIHNAICINEYKKAVKEMYRLLFKNGKLIFSVFTNDIITSDLTETEQYCYNIKNRPPMVLLPKEMINKIFEDVGFTIDKVIDEHVTYVGDNGARYVYSFVASKN